MATQSNNLNQEMLSQTAIWQQALKYAEKLAEETDEASKAVSRFAKSYSDLNKGQQEFITKYTQAHQKLMAQYEAEGRSLEGQKKLGEELAKLMETRERNQMQFIQQYGTAEEKAAERKQQAEDRYQQLLKNREDIMNEYAQAEVEENQLGILEARKKLEQQSKNEKAALAEKKKLDKEYWIYAQNSASEAEKIIHAERLKSEISELRRKKKLSSEEKSALKEKQKALAEYQRSLGDEQAEEKKAAGERGAYSNRVGSSKTSYIGNVGVTYAHGSAGEDIKNAISEGFKELGKKLNGVVDNAVKLVSEYQQKINFRLETVGTDFDEIFGDVKRIVGNSGAVQQQKVIEKIGEAVDKGIAYNVEQRAFLETIGKNIQSTFEAFDSNLMRIIRIQQQDSTASRLGMEKALNDMLNSYYKDTSYLTQTFDEVSSALFEMTANQSRNQAVETEFVVQKWLGSLYSLGASSNAVQQIATGLGYLGSGNVQALAGNTGLQNLLALSASRAGKDYAELLTSGLDASDINDLMKAMVEYLAEIADSTSQNKVVTSAYGNIFGLSLSDIRSFQNLSSSVSDIYSESMDYASSLNYLQNSLNNYTKYMGTAQYMSNMWENITLGTGMMYSNGVGYLLYKAVDLLDNLTNGGPNIDLSYWGIGTDFHLFDLIKSGMFGVGLIGSLISGGIANDEALNLQNWGYEDVVSRGTGFGLKATSGTSFSQNVGNASSSDVTSQTLQEGTETASTVEAASGTEQKKDIDDLYEAMVNPGDKGQLSNVSQTVVSMDQKLQKAMELLDEISSVGSRKSVNINLQKIAGKDVGTGSDVPLLTSPSVDWEKLIVAASVLIKYGAQMNGFGGQAIQQIANADTEENARTLQEFLDLMVPILESDTGVPVRLESVDSMTNLMTDLTKR